MSYTSANAAEDVITIIRGAINRGWLDPKYLAPGWDFYTRMDQVVINALNALVAIQITVTKNKTNKSELQHIQSAFVLPIDRVFENITGSISSVCGYAWGGGSCAMDAMGLTKNQLIAMQKGIAQWQPMRNKIFDMFDKDGLYKGQGWLAAVLTIVGSVAAVAAPALLFASSGIGAAGVGAGAAAASGGTAASTAATTAAATVGTTASTAAAVAGGAKAAADLAKGGTSAATQAIKTTTSAIKTGGTLASHVGDVIQSSGIVKDALPIAQAVLSQQGVNTQDPQTQAALQKAMQEAQNAVSTQMLNGNVKTNPNQIAPATTFSWSKMLPIALSGGAILLEAMKK